MKKEKIIQSSLELTAAQVIQDFTTQGYSVVDQFLQAEEVSRLRAYITNLKNQEVLKKAAIGNLNIAEVNEDVRGDYINWIDFAQNSLLSEIVESKISMLMQQMNRQLYLGIKDYEFHTTVYPPGTRYARHFDRFKYNSNRVVSMVMYLNDEWITGNGGELKIYHTDQTTTLIEPIAGRLVTFLSDEIEHEVLETNYERYSITGWLLNQPKALKFIRNH